MRQPGADARSKEMEFAGLPKAVKLRLSVNDNAPVAGTNTVLRYDVVTFNYGTFGLRLNTVGGFNGYDGVIIKEPGVYEITSRVLIAGGAGASYLFLGVNGLTLPDGTNAYDGGPALPANGALVVTDKLELKSGDIVSAYNNQAATPQIIIANFTVLIVEKLGGQY